MIIMGAYVIPVTLSVVRRPSSVSSVAPRGMHISKQHFIEIICCCRGFTLKHIGVTTYIGHKDMTQKKVFFHISWVTKY